MLKASGAVLAVRWAGRWAGRWAVPAGLGICAAGLLLRVIGLDFGLPFIYDPDEPDFVGRAWQMVTTGDLNPHWFGHPGTTVMYAFAGVFKGYSALAFPDLAAAATAFLTEPSRFYLLARVVVVLLAFGTLVLTWQLARRVAGNGAALLAAALLAVAPLQVQYSRLARPDLLMSFLLLASVLCALQIAREGRWRDYLAAGFLLGLAIATKYPAVIAAPAIVLAHALGQLDQGRPVWARVERLFGAGGATVAGAFVGSPFMFVEWRLVLENVVKEARPYHLGGTSDGFLATLWWYLDGTLIANLGVVGLLLATLGALSALARGFSREGRSGANQAALLVLTFPLLFVPFIASLSLRWDRWLLPALPFLCVLAALGFRDVAVLLRYRVLAGVRAGVRAGVLAQAVLVAVALLAISLPAVDAVLWTRAVAQPDTRTLAYDWLLENVPADSRVLVEAYSPQLPADRFRLYVVNQGYIDRLEGGQRQYPVPTGIIGTLRNPSLVGQARIDYVLLANHYDRRLAEPQRYARQIAVYEELMSTSELLYQAEPSRGHAAGLTVRVFKVRR